MQPVGLLGDLLQEAAAVLGVVDGAVEQRLDAGLDDRQRRLQLVRDVGDELLPQPFQAAQLGGVVQHEHGAARRRARQAGGVDGQAAAGGAVPVQLLAAAARAWPGPARTTSCSGALADHLPELAADGGLGGNSSSCAGPLVGEQDALLGVEGDDALDHAAEDGAQLLAVFLELGELRGQALAHVVEGAGQGADLVLAGGVDLVAVVAGGDALGPGGQLLQRPGDAPGQPEGQGQGGERR